MSGLKSKKTLQTMTRQELRMEPLARAENFGRNRAFLRLSIELTELLSVGRGKSKLRGTAGPLVAAVDLKKKS